MTRSAVLELEFSVSALHALQKVLDLPVLRGQLHLQPQLNETIVPLTEAEHNFLVEKGFLVDGAIDPEVAAVLRILATPDAEIELTLTRPGFKDSFVSIVRRGELIITASFRGGDMVYIDAYEGRATEEDVTILAVDTIRSQMFPAGDDGVGADFQDAIVPLNDLVAVSSQFNPEDWGREFGRLGIPADAADIMHEGEVSNEGRAEFSAYLNHENGRTPPDTVLRVTLSPSGAHITSFATDQNRKRWLTVEPYSPSVLDRRVLSALRSVPDRVWMTHDRGD